MAKQSTNDVKTSNQTNKECLMTIKQKLPKSNQHEQEVKDEPSPLKTEPKNIKKLNNKKKPN